MNVCHLPHQVANQTMLHKHSFGEDMLQYTLSSNSPQDAAPTNMYWQALQTPGLAALELELRTLALLEFPLR
jgi:hypothetical protein